jgi:hypothetical protein
MLGLSLGVAVEEGVAAVAVVCPAAAAVEDFREVVA